MDKSIPCLLTCPPNEFVALEYRFLTAPAESFNLTASRISPTCRLFYRRETVTSVRLVHAERCLNVLCCGGRALLPLWSYVGITSFSFLAAVVLMVDLPSAFLKALTDILPDRATVPALLAALRYSPTTGSALLRLLSRWACLLSTPRHNKTHSVRLWSRWGLHLVQIGRIISVWTGQGIALDSLDRGR